MKINILSIPTGYKATFDLSPVDEYYMLASLLELNKKWEYGHDPVDAVELLVRTAIESIRSLGITSTPLIEVINDVANEKIKELEAMRPISLKINVGKKNDGTEIYDARIIPNKTGEYKMVVSSVNSFYNIPCTRLSEIHCCGDNEIEAIDNLISSLTCYKNIVLEYIKDVRELCEREKDKRKLRG